MQILNDFILFAAVPSLALELSEGKNNNEDDRNGELLLFLLLTSLSSSCILQLIVSRQ